MCFVIGLNEEWSYIRLNLKYAGIARWKPGGTCAENRFGLSAKRTSPFKSAGVSVQSTAGRRGVQISGQRLYRPYSDVQCKTIGYPLHSHLSPSLPRPCVTVCRHISTGLYQELSELRWPGQEADLKPLFSADSINSWIYFVPIRFNC